MTHATFVHECPHCGAENVAFTARAFHTYENILSVLASCNRCQCSILAIFCCAQENISTFLEGGLDLLNHKYLELLRVYPEVEPPQVPQGVSDAIARPFIEAADNLRQKKYSSACAMFRRVLEIALKEFAQDIEARTLEKRIDKLAADHLITPAMKEWAHNLRLDGNEAIHGLEEATQELAEQMHDLCKFLLIYLYTLPKQVAEARNKRGVV